MPAPPRTTYPLRDRSLAVGGLLVISLAMILAMRGGRFASWLDFGFSWGISLSYTLVLGWGNRQLWVVLQSRLPRVEQTKKRLWWLGISSVVYTSAATIALALAIPALVPSVPRLPGSLLAGVAAINLIPTLIGQLIYESRHALGQWQANQRRADQLAQAATQAQLDALARQLDPHFLFNSLNTLAALIEPANAAAQHYVENLADVYRYVLTARARPTVPLAEELSFVRTYLALQQVRFGESLRVELRTHPAALARQVAPLSVQELVENALKHNEASRARPLHLLVAADAADGDTVRVANTYQPRPPGLAPSTGTGLANLRQRYALLGAGQPLTAGVVEGQFVVRLPLLP